MVLSLVYGKYIFFYENHQVIIILIFTLININQNSFRLKKNIFDILLHI